MGTKVISSKAQLNNRGGEYKEYGIWYSGHAIRLFLDLQSGGNKIKLASLANISGKLIGNSDRLEKVTEEMETIMEKKK